MHDSSLSIFDTKGYRGSALSHFNGLHVWPRPNRWGLQPYSLQATAPMGQGKAYAAHIVSSHYPMVCGLLTMGSMTTNDKTNAGTSQARNVQSERDAAYAARIAAVKAEVKANCAARMARFLAA